MIKAFFKYRRLYVVLLHLAIVAVANYGAIWLRFDGAIPADEYALLMQMFPWICAAQALSFIPFRLYEGLWRYTSISDLANIICAVFFSEIMVYVLTRWLFNTKFSRGALITDAVLLVLL